MNPHSKSELRPGTQLRDKVRGLVREELLQAAEAVFAEEGLQTAKVESIAGRAGVSVGTVYNYFSDRQALVDAVMQARREDLIRQLEELDRETVGQPFLVRLDASLDYVLQFFVSQKPYYLLMLQAEGMPFLHTLSPPDPTQGPFGSLYAHMGRLIGEGMREGAIRKDEEPVLVVKFLIGICKGMGLMGMLDPNVHAVRVRKEAILRLFLHGAGSASTPAG